MDSLLCQFTATGYIVTAICGIAVLILAHYLLKRLAIYNKVKATLGGLWQGIISLKGVRNVPLYIALTLGIWLSYFFHYYLTFQCFEATSHLNLMCGLVTFIVGSIAVIVPILTEPDLGILLSRQCSYSMAFRQTMPSSSFSSYTPCKPCL